MHCHLINFFHILLVNFVIFWHHNFCVACEAWLTHRDHDSVSVIHVVVTLLVSDQ